MKKILSIVLVGLLLIGATSCGSKNIENTSGDKKVEVKKEVVYDNKNYVDYVSEKNIVRDTSKLDKIYSKYYVKYLDYIAPNGKPIRIVAADKVTDEQMLKAYNVLSFYLRDFGDYKKADVANSMADKGAVLVMPNGADGDGNTPGKALMGQPLYQMETPVAGSKWYQENDYGYRDAAYEEIFHMVHDYGIGTTQNPAALPELSNKIKAGLDSVLPKNKADWGEKGIWGLGSKEWMIELSKEASLEQEYIVSGIDSYYGLWGAYTESDKGMWGMYVPKTRKDVEEKDPKAYEIVNTFLGENLTYMERIAPEFEGTFSISFDKSQPYTHKSQYLQHVRLTGEKNSNLEGNDFDNIFIGNKGNNKMDGKKGEDVVQFAGKSTEYTISKDGDSIIVKDKNDRDGQDSLVNIEILRFTDKDIMTKDIH